jgi:hypothetical protein
MLLAVQYDGRPASPDGSRNFGIDAHGRFAQQAAEQGGKIVRGDALQPSATATAIRADRITTGPFGPDEGKRFAAIA